MAIYALPPGSKGTIPLSDAERLTANWQAYLADSDLVTKAFVFSIDTFKNLMSSNADADGIRIYLGLKTAGDPKSLTALMVPVIDNKDIVAVSVGNGSGDGDGDNVYNFSNPCPNVCDFTSPLGGG